MPAVAAIVLAASLETALSFGKLGARPPAGSVRTENDQLTQEQPTSEQLSDYGGATFVQYVSEWLAASKMSAPAQKSVVEFLQSH